MKKDLFEKKKEQTVSKHNILENYLETNISQMLLKATVKPPRITYDDKGLVKQVADGSIIKRFDKTPCKETKAMWEKLRMDWSRIRCNCVW